MLGPQDANPAHRVQHTQNLGILKDKLGTLRPPIYLEKYFKMNDAYTEHSKTFIKRT
jgi:hypothetical protein